MDLYSHPMVGIAISLWTDHSNKKTVHGQTIVLVISSPLDRKGMEMKTQTQKRPWLIVLIGGCLICFIGFIVINMSGILPEVAPLPTNTPKPTVTIPPTVSPAQTYFEQYGGNINV